MKLETGWVELVVDGRPARGYTARPAVVGKLPGVIVIQEAFGVDAFVRDMTERLATAGYAVIAPDLFSVGGTPVPLSAERVDEARVFLDGVPPAAWFDATLRKAPLELLASAHAARITETLAMLLPPTRPWPQYLATLGAGHAWLAAGPSEGQKIGALGFCMGGALAQRLACVDPELAAGVAFYGTPPPLELIDGISCPILAHYAELDPSINAQVPKYADALLARGKSFTQHAYAGTKHAFMNDTRANFDVRASRVAWARTLTFLAGTL